MKRVPLLSVLLSLSILAGFLFFFPLEWVALLVLLLGLIAIQVIIVRRHLHVAASSRSAAPSRSAMHEAAVQAATRRGRRGASARAASKDAGAESAAGAGAQPGEGEGQEPAAGKGGAETPFDPALFSRFRAQLDEAERETAGRPPQAPAADSAPEVQPEPPAADTAPVVPPPEPPAADTPPVAPPPAAEAAPEEGADVTDRVVLSPAARRKAGAAKAAADGPAASGQEAAEASEEDLFADLRPELPQGTKGRAGKARGAGSAAGAESAAGAKGRKPAKNKPASPPAAEAESSGPAAPAAEAVPGANDEAGEASVLLKLAEDALNTGDRAGARAGLEQVLALHADSRDGLPWRVKLMQSRLAVLEGDIQGALDGYDELLEARPALEENDYLGQIEELTASQEGAEGASLRVSLLLKLLARFRQANDRAAMDRIYGLIENAQERAGDEQKLIQYYKNHLEIKSVMEDVEGQLALIDLIGNRYYKLGDTEAARQFYEQGLKLREERAAAAGESESSAG